MQGTLVRPVARYPGNVATDAALKVAANRVQATLVSAIGSGDTLITVSNASRLVPDMLLSIDSEIVSVTSINGNILTVVRGFDGTFPAPHPSGRTLNANIVAWHHNALAAEIEAIETALGPNLSNISGDAANTLAGRYAWAQTPGGTLTGGSVNTVTLTPVPPGVNGTDKRHYVYVSGGTGAPEPVLIVGGTAVAGAASGTILFTPVNNHTGSWSIGTATAGGQEALQQTCYSPNAAGIVSYGPGEHHIYAPVCLLRGGVGLTGAGIHVTQLTQHTQNTDFIQVGDNVDRISGLTVSDLSLAPHSSMTAGTSGYGINVRFAGAVRIDNVRIYAGNKIWRGMNLHDVVIGEICHSLIEQTVDRGIVVEGEADVILGGRGNSDIKIWLTIVALPGSDALFIGDYSVAHYIFQNEFYGMKSAYGINISPTIPGSYNYFIRDNDISTSPADGGVNAGGIRLAQYVSADLSGNDAGSSAARPAIMIEGSDSDARIVGFMYIGAETAIRNYGRLQLVGGAFNGMNQALDAIKVESTATLTNISGCVFYQYAGQPIRLDNNAANICISGNNFKSSPGVPVGWLGTPKHMVAAANTGIDDLIATVASAATITIGSNPEFVITGTTTILNINGGWDGRRVHFTKPNVGDVTVGSAGGGNVQGAHVLTGYGTLTLVCTDGVWF